MPMRDIVVEILKGDLFKEIMEHGACRYAVGVIIAVDDDPLAIFIALMILIGRFRRVFQKERVVRMCLEIRPKEILRRGAVRYAAAMQQSRREIGIFDQPLARICRNIWSERVFH